MLLRQESWLCYHLNMRLSKDSSSYRSSNIIRRDFRHSKDGPEVVGKGKKKSTSLSVKYCDAAKTEEHNFSTRSFADFGLDKQQVVQAHCSKCNVCIKKHRKGQFFQTMTRGEFHQFTGSPLFVFSLREHQAYSQEKVDVYMYDGDFIITVDRWATLQKQQPVVSYARSDEAQKAMDRERWAAEGRDLSGPPTL